MYTCNITVVYNPRRAAQLRWRQACPVASFGLLLWVAVLGLLVSRPANAQALLLEPRQPAGQATLDLNTWCADYRRGQPKAGAGELKRLRVVERDLAPGFNPGSRTDGIDLLLAYRQELEKRRPDQTLAATYLALASATPISFGLVERVNALLCVTSTRGFALAVADAAEAERRQMAR